jgi:hypothetical protein
MKGSKNDLGFNKLAWKPTAIPRLYSQRALALAANPTYWSVWPGISAKPVPDLRIISAPA